MRASKHPGKCKLCGEFKELTFEHVPPKKAFNSSAVKIISFEESLKLITGENQRMPWDTTGLKGKIQQKGGGGYYLCRECNNNTGSWYVEEYTTFANTMNSLINTEKIVIHNGYSFKILGIHPLRILKAVMTMFCDINNNCFGDEELRSFLLNKKSQEFDTEKYSLYMYLVSPTSSRIASLNAIYYFGEKESVLSSEIAVYPLGFALYRNLPEDYKPFGVCINEFSKFSYDEKCDVDIMNIPYTDLNSQLPLDYRSKEEIVKCINDNDSFINE